MTTFRLVIRSDHSAERAVDLREGVTRIGRSADNDVVLSDADKGVSRAHAELHIAAGRCTIVDLHSQNGTWLNGLRVQRAEVRPEAEVAIGLYRLKLRTVTASAASDRASMARSAPIVANVTTPDERTAEAASFGPGGADLPLSPSAGASNVVPVTTRLDKPLEMPRYGDTRPRSGPRTPLIVGGMVAVGVAALLIGRFVVPKSTPATSVTPPPAITTSAPTPGVSSAPPGTNAQSAGAGTDNAPAPASAPPPSAAATSRSGASTPRSQAGSPPVRSAARGSAAAQEATRAYASPTPVTRKPGESVDEWRERSAALQARYAYSKVALDRGDFAAAAGGFSAILVDEPGFLDSPQLLVKAREGLRAAAGAAFESGNRLDAAGDWMSALRKYDQAREIDRALPGLDSAIARVREKMHVAGNEALARARQHDAAGRTADALNEYEKAAQWLPVDDANRDAARARAEQLKAKK